MTNDDTLSTPTRLLEQFRWMENPSCDPIRTKMRQFFVGYVHSKGSEGANIEEIGAAFNQTVSRDPESWPAPADQLQTLWRDTTCVTDKLPPLTRPAQLVWLGIEAGYDKEVIDAALFHEFPLFTPHDMAKAYGEAAAHMQRERNSLAMQAAVFDAWAEIEKAKGRPENELRFGECVDALGIVEKRDDGSSYLNFNKLKDIADPQLRRAVLGAAWKADQERRSDIAAVTHRYRG